MNELPPFAILENPPLGPAPLHPKFRLGEQPHPVQVAGFRRATAAEKFRQMEEMYRSCVAVKRRQFARKFPAWSEETLEREARRAVMYGPD